MARTKRADLDMMADAIDDALDLPRGTHHIQGAYGGYQLKRERGAYEVSHGFVPMGELMDWLRAYKSGIYAGRKAAAQAVATGATLDDYGMAR